MSRFVYILLFLVSLSLVACASNEKKAPEIKEDFVTNIDENGLKLFSYTVTMAVPENRGGDMQGGRRGMRDGKGDGGMRGGGMRGSGNGGRSTMNNAKPNREAMMQRAKEVVYEKLKTKLDETGYCRESYIERDNYFVRGRSQIRGECNELATEEDRDLY